MDTATYQRASELFAELIHRPDCDRESWLKGQTDDPAVLSLVHQLCRQDDLFDSKAAKLGESLQQAESTRGSHPDQADTKGSANATEEPSLTDGFGDYTDLVEIGRGGLGRIFRARQISLNREVALKMIRQDADSSSSNRLRFQLEAEAAARLDHPNIVPIYQIGSEGATQFFAMKLIDGVDLSKWLRTESTGLREKVGIVRKAALAIHYAHQGGVLHRDIKPANILIDSDGDPHVTDFGLAKHLGAEADLTVTGQIMGTPSYMSPEQASGAAPTTIATDVYGLGALLYECLTGRPPLVGENMIDTIRLVVDAEPEPPSRQNSSVDRDLDTICMKCLAKEPEQRYQSARELADELGRWLDDQPILARPVSLPERLTKWIRRNQALAAMSAFAVAVVCVAILVVSWLGTGYWNSLRDRQTAEIIQEIRDADTDELTELSERLTSHFEAAQPKLAQYFEKADAGAPEKLNVALSLSTQDPGYLDYVIRQLGQLSVEDFHTAINYLRPHGSLIAGELIKIFQQSEESGAIENQRSAAAAALIQLNLAQVIWPSFSRENENRHVLIHGLAKRRPDPIWFMKQLEGETDAATRSALVQLIGMTDLEKQSREMQNELTKLMSDLYRSDPDPAVHSFARLSLQRWEIPLPETSAEEPLGQDRELTELDAEITRLRDRLDSVFMARLPDQDEWQQRYADLDSGPPNDFAVAFDFDDSENRYLERVSTTGGRMTGRGPAKWGDGVLGTAAYLGDDNTIEAETDYYPEYTDPFSMGCWIHREVKVDKDEYGTVFSRSVPGDAGFDLWIDDGALGMHLVSFSTGGWLVKVTGVEKLPTEQWTHIFVAYDGSGKADGVRLFVNGLLVDKRVMEREVGGSIHSDAPFCIGQRYVGDNLDSTERFPFHGAVDEIRLFNRQLSDYEVEQLYQDAMARISRLLPEERSAVQETLLERHHAAEVAERLKKELAVLVARKLERQEQLRRRWFVSAGGPSFSVVSRPGFRGRLPYSIAVSTCPTTVDQYQSFARESDYHRSEITYDTSLSPTTSCPINSVSRNDVAAYCNWLSERDKIPVEQWCYEVVDYEVVKDFESPNAGSQHRIFYEEKPDSQKLTGYRLPSLDEWHFLCLAGSRSPYSYGGDVSLASRYVWSKENANDQSHPVGALFPNDFGVFDMHGGLWEWTAQGARHDCRLVGGSINDSAERLRYDISQSRHMFSRDGDTTFRVVRTMK